MPWQLETSKGWILAPFKAPPKGATAGKKGDFNFQGLPCSVEFTSETAGTVTSKGKSYACKLVEDGTASKPPLSDALNSKLESLPVNPLSFIDRMPMGHDLTRYQEHDLYMECADLLYNGLSLDELRELQNVISEKIEDTWNYSTLFHIAVADAVSKKLMKDFPALHCTVVYAMYHEKNRMVRKGDDVPGESHPNGEDFIRRKHKQMTWLFSDRSDCSWSLMGADDGCDHDIDSGGLMEKISKEEGYTNTKVVRLKEAVVAGSCDVLDNEKLKSVAWDPADKLVKASQKGGAIIYALNEARKVDTGGKEHIIVYTDSDLSTDLALSGLNFKTIFDGVDCSVSQRFGQPHAVNCGKLMGDGGVAPGMPTPSMVHLSLRHKLRKNMLPPLAPITDTNCGHKAIRANALDGVLQMVKDYKGSFDMDWLMCVGICSKKAGREAIGVTPIPWVNSVAESNFWGGGGGGDESPEAAKMKSATSWHKIFAAMITIFDWHKDGLQAAGLVTPDTDAYAKWVRAMSVQHYMKLSDEIEKELGESQVTMPEDRILNLDLSKMQVMSGHSAAHGPWKDETFAASSADPHCPHYFKAYSDFGEQLKAYPGELMLKDALTEEMYNKYKGVETKLGVTLDKCIKGGVDKVIHGDTWNVGKVGLLFGDAESVKAFPDLVHPIMLARHGNPTLPHPPPNLDGSQLLDHTGIDDAYVISTRIRTGRTISGFPLPPSIGADQRKELESIVTKALLAIEGELKGDYYPLAGSNTYEPKPFGIDKATEKQLVEDHFLFQEPDEPMLLSWRMERDWPQARGIYHNENKTALVWVNEEDHLRIISMEKGKNVRAVFDRFANLVKTVEDACKASGRGLEIDSEYGNILSCPSNCGTGLRGSMMIKIPLASKEPTFKQWCADRKLQARGSGGFASAAADDGIRDVSNVDRMGKDEVTLVNEMIKGVQDLINWEKELEKK